MSLRQRGQRPSEATNEGGYHYASPRTHPPRSSPPSSSGSAHQTPQSARPMQRSKSSSSSAGYNSGGYYNSTAGYANASSNLPNTATASRYAASPSPMLNQPAAQPSYPNTAPPGYRGYDRSVSMPSISDAPQPRTLQFDTGGAVGGTGGGYGSGPYAGYGNTQSSNNATSNVVSNPYHKSKSSSGGVGLKHILLSLFAITFLVLSGTTLYFRNIMKRTELQLQDAKIFLAEQTRQDTQAQRRQNGEKYAGGRGGGHEQRRRQQQHGNRARPEDAGEKIKLEAEIKALEDEVEGFKKSYEDFGLEIDTHRDTLDELNEQKQALLKKIDHTNNLLEDQVEESSKYKAMVDGLDEVEEYMKKREGALWSRIDVLEGKIARESSREAEEWFGPGPHRVVMEIEYPKVQLTNPDSSSWPRITNKFAIEMAPLDLIPHTVNLFLQQVHHGLWDKCQVVSMAKHIFQLGPSYDDRDKPDGAEMDVPNLGDDPRDRPGDPHYDHFHAKGLDKISYQEYSDKFPHDQWTVGLAGRPGGPDFYINKLDNTLIHGPGGQTNRHDLHNEADPCFGKIVEGLETLIDLDTIPVNEERGHALMYPVVILAAHVVVPKENPADGWRVVDRGTKLKKDDDIMPLPEVPHGV